MSISSLQWHSPIRQQRIRVDKFREIRAHFENHIGLRDQYDNYALFYEINE